MLAKALCLLAVAVAVMAAVVAGPAAVAAPLYNGVYEGVTVTPATVSEPGQLTTVAGPGFPGDAGCVIGLVLAIPEGKGRGDAKILARGSLDQAWSFSARSFDREEPFTAGTFDIVLDCTDDSNSKQLRSTTATLTVTAAATVTTTSTTPSTTPSTTVSTTTSSTSTTTTVPEAADSQGSVVPAVAKPGVTELTIRGAGFGADEPLRISLRTAPELAVATTRSTASGVYAATLTLPVTAPPGAQQLLVSGVGAEGGTHVTQARLSVEQLTCADFASPAAAQAAVGVAGTDPHGLDADRDGFACGSITAASAGGGGVVRPAGTLPETGARLAPVGVMAGLTVLTMGALLVGLSHPPGEPAGPGRRAGPGHAARSGEATTRGRHHRRRPTRRAP